MEGRGNHALYNDANVNVGVEQTASTMHFGPRWDINGYSSAHATKNRSPGFDSDFHVYKMVWTPLQIQFYIDDERVLMVSAGNGFWSRGGFSWSGLENPWINGTIMAPFDEEFYIIMNNAVGGTAYFQDKFDNRNGGKPWLNSSSRSRADFWNGRSQWESSWSRQTDQSHVKVDYVRVYAL